MNKGNNKENVVEISKNKIKWIRSLQLKKNRDEEGVFIVEGEKMVNEVISSYPNLIHTLIYTPDFQLTNMNLSGESYCVNQLSLDQASGLKTPNKAIAILKKIKTTLPTEDQLILALDGVQDPGNMGTILRIADWFGINHIICSPSTVEVYNPKVVQSSMGAVLRINVHYTDLKEYFRKTSMPVFAALLQGENIYRTKLSDIGIILLGNEGKGISRELYTHVSHQISIPRFGSAESLNVSVAAGIIVSEFKRNS